MPFLKRTPRAWVLVELALLCLALSYGPAAWCADPDRTAVEAAMRKAAGYFRGQAVAHGGYVYHYSLDLQQRWGEGEATVDQVWVQPPGTPTVGLAYLAAHRATGDPFYLEAARAAAESLVYGQLRSGGWTNCIDFNPRGARVAAYRHGNGKGRNTSSLDDGQTSSALLLLLRVDQALEFRHAAIHDAAAVGLQALLAAQFPNGGFPQVWDDAPRPTPAAHHFAAQQASYPDYDWRTEGRIKEYWTMYTLNDNVCGYVAEALIAAHDVYHDERYLAALRRLGDFFLAAQMPAPQPGWAQQYNFSMQPIWARKFEPPAVAGDETQEAIETLLRIHAVTGDPKYLTPIPTALAYLRRSLLADGHLARYYELRTNRPLYMTRRGDEYTLTYDDTNLPDHYGWQTQSRCDALEQAWRQAERGDPTTSATVLPLAELARNVAAILAQQDDQGRWVSVYASERLVGQPKFPVGMKYLSSDTFSRHLTTLSEYIGRTRP